MFSDKINCLVLCGGEKSTLTEKEGVSNKALIRIGGREMITYVIRTLLKVVSAKRIVVVGPVVELDFIKDYFGVEVIPEKGSIVKNVVAGVDFFNSNDPLIVSSSDIPLLTEKAVRDFLQGCVPWDLDFYCPIIAKEKTENSFPESKRTYVKIREGIFTGGNIFLINPAKIGKFTEIGNAIMEARKNPLRIASFFGYSFLFRFARGTMTIDQAVSRLEREGIRAKVIISPYPEIGFDVDKTEHLEIVKKTMKL